MKFAETPQRFLRSPAAHAEAARPAVDGADTVTVALATIISVAGAKSTDAAEAQRRLDATDSEHWFAVNFETRAQKNEFLAAVELADIGDKYLAGVDIAETLAILLEAPEEDRAAVAEALRGIAQMRAPKFRPVTVSARLESLTKPSRP